MLKRALIAAVGLAALLVGGAWAYRQAMIRGMVDGLAERLATEGGPAEDWARLIRALGVLGDTDRARAIWDEARTVFADTPGLPTVQAAAEAAGLNE